MGLYLNPGNSGFESMIKGTYVDKTELISLINNTINTPERFTCVCRPRRFGKTFAVKMLCAYYDRSCESDKLFDGLMIKEDPSYPIHLNKYNVILLYIPCIKRVWENNTETLVHHIEEIFIKEITSAYPDVKYNGNIKALFNDAVTASGSKFILIIDSWDAPIRESSFTPDEVSEYLEFLHMLFNISDSSLNIFAAVYMTGVLPPYINNAQSVLPDFNEITMIALDMYPEYFGFTQKEVDDFCRKHCIDKELMNKWYNGYESKSDVAIYNPHSVVYVLEFGFLPHWTQTASNQALVDLIEKEFDGLTNDITELIGGGSVHVDITSFCNDPQNCRNKDDVLTLMIHYGYLTYDSANNKVRIPNKEILQDFSLAYRRSKNIVL